MQFTVITLSLVALATGVFAAPQLPNATIEGNVSQTSEPPCMETPILPPGVHPPNGSFPHGPLPHGPCGSPIIPVPHNAAPSLMTSTGALAVGVAAAVAFSI
ncbi:hypothetical protein GGR55DRAFT_618899 [Xylaria sp. FL0064]|nr:hypothetical protein GGR55DRAFT_618899 [Xylaria sp. FL0064]